MNPTLQGCAGYTVQIKTYDITAPTVYKCMTEQEYAAYRQQVYQQDHGNDPLLFMLAVGFVLFVLIVALTTWLLSRTRKKKVMQRAGDEA